MWTTHPSPTLAGPHQAQPTPLREPLPYLSTHPDTAPFWVHNVHPGRGMLYVSDTPATPLAEVRDVLMGFRVGDTAAAGLSALQRVKLLGQPTDLNTLAWTISTIRMHTSSAEHDPTCTFSPTERIGGCTFSQALQGMMDILLLPLGGASTLRSAPLTAPTPHPWTPRF